MILNLGPLEIMAIAILTLIVFGPERLPILLGQLGRTIRRFRDWYVQLAANIRTELQPVEDELKEIRQVAAEVQNDLADIRNAVDLRAMLPPIDVPAEMNGNTPEPVIASGGAPAQLPAAPQQDVKRDANLAADNPWGGGAPAPKPAEESKTGALAEDNPWAKA